jgi:hypothetical protein
LAKRRRRASAVGVDASQAEREQASAAASLRELNINEETIEAFRTGASVSPWERTEALALKDKLFADPAWVARRDAAH